MYHSFGRLAWELKDLCCQMYLLSASTPLGNLWVPRGSKVRGAIALQACVGDASVVHGSVRGCPKRASPPAEAGECGGSVLIRGLGSRCFAIDGFDSYRTVRLEKKQRITYNE